MRGRDTPSSFCLISNVTVDSEIWSQEVNSWVGYVKKAIYESCGLFSVFTHLRLSLSPPLPLSLLTGWWFVSIGDQEGWAPCSYLEKLNWEDEEEDEVVTSLGTLHSKSSILHSPFSILNR